MIVEVPENTRSVEFVGPVAMAELSTGEMVPVSVRDSRWENAFVFNMASKIFERNPTKSPESCFAQAKEFLQKALESKLL
jgi:hypothetical protein